tara:strand:+ start:272 stop:607 length:336 start_codon:yes stop_codon:yes gene_type:complete
VVVDPLNLLFQSLLQHIPLQLVKVEEELGLKEPLVVLPHKDQIHRLRDQLSQQLHQWVVVVEQQTIQTTLRMEDLEDQVAVQITTLPHLEELEQQIRDMLEVTGAVVNHLG